MKLLLNIVVMILLFIGGYYLGINAGVESESTGENKDMSEKNLENDSQEIEENVNHENVKMYKNTEQNYHVMIDNDWGTSKMCQVEGDIVELTLFGPNNAGVYTIHVHENTTQDEIIASVGNHLYDKGRTEKREDVLLDKQSQGIEAIKTTVKSSEIPDYEVVVITFQLGDKIFAIYGSETQHFTDFYESFFSYEN